MARYRKDGSGPRIVSARLSQGEHTRLEVLVKRQKYPSISKLIRILITQFLSANKSVGEPMAKAAPLSISEKVALISAQINVRLTSTKPNNSKGGNWY